MNMESKISELDFRKIARLMRYSGLVCLGVAFFCDISFFKLFTPDGQISDPDNIFFISAFRLSFALLGLVLLAAFFLFRDALYRILRTLSLRFSLVRNRRLPIGRFVFKPPVKIRIVSLAILAVLALVTSYGVCFNRTWLNDITRENGVVETLTVFVYLFAAFLALKRIMLLGRRGKQLSLERFWLMLLALFFVFVAMEEINWGQTYFNYVTPGIFREVNIQGQMSLHNMPLPFNYSWSYYYLPWFALIIGLVIPFLVWAIPSLTRLFWAFELPLPSGAACCGFVLVFLIPLDYSIQSILIIDNVRLNIIGEMQELILGVSFLMLVWHLRYRRGYADDPFGAANVSHKNRTSYQILRGNYADL
ncbi:MAG: hypothetical protein JW734_05625 [Candidatus Omnitrophica bacterium]|nr:hypothetical protein [Candidatus Omnitrophota bacterium]